MERKSEFTTDVVIVGAGVSGLSAAYYLNKKDPSISVTVLEAKDRIGGRTVGMTALSSSGSATTWDLGGQWVGTCQPHVMKLLDELDLKTYPQFSTGRKLVQLANHKVTSYKNEIPSLSLPALIDLSLFMYKISDSRIERVKEIIGCGLIDQMRKRINVSNPGEGREAAEWDEITVEEFKRRHLWTQASSDTLDAACRCMFGVDPSHMSLLYFLAYAACAGGLEPLISSREKIGGQELRIQEGAWSICHRLQAAMPKVKVLTSMPVTNIVQLGLEDSSTQNSDVVEGNGLIQVKTQNGSIFVCRRVIMAIPPHLSTSISYEPALPLSKHFVMERMPVGYLTKIICTYSETFWRRVGLSGEVVTCGGRPVVDGCTRGPLCIIMDATSYSGHPALVSFIGGSQQLEYSHLSLADRRKAVLHSLADFFGPEALSPIDYIEKNWNEEPYNGGCPVSVGTPGMMTRFPAALREPFYRIHYAGTESATVWCGFINGAVQSGYRAAAEVLHNLRPGLLSQTELQGTVYQTTSRQAESPACRKCFWFVSAALTAGCVAAFVIKKIRK